jgi:integral membrane protein
MTAPKPAPPTTPGRRQGDPKIKAALTRYRVLAYITGVWLLVLTAEIIYKYLILDDSSSAPSWFFYIGQAHGVFYMLYLVMTIDLAIKVRWKGKVTIMTALAGTIPFLSFVAERARTAQVKRDFAV